MARRRRQNKRRRRRGGGAAIFFLPTKKFFAEFLRIPSMHARAAYSVRPVVVQPESPLGLIPYFTNKSLPMGEAASARSSRASAGNGAESTMRSAHGPVAWAEMALKRAKWPLLPCPAALINANVAPDGLNSAIEFRAKALGSAVRPVRAGASAFSSPVTAIGGSVRPVWASVTAFSESVTPFWSAVTAFWTSVRPFLPSVTVTAVEKGATSLGKDATEPQEGLSHVRRGVAVRQKGASRSAMELRNARTSKVG
jgi:hypothetical protein